MRKLAPYVLTLGTFISGCFNTGSERDLTNPYRGRVEFDTLWTPPGSTEPLYHMAVCRNDSMHLSFGVLGDSLTLDSLNSKINRGDYIEVTPTGVFSLDGFLASPEDVRKVGN